MKKFAGLLILTLAVALAGCSGSSSSDSGGGGGSYASTALVINGEVTATLVTDGDANAVFDGDNKINAQGAFNYDNEEVKKLLVGDYANALIKLSVANNGDLVGYKEGSFSGRLEAWVGKRHADMDITVRLNLASTMLVTLFPNLTNSDWDTAANLVRNIVNTAAGGMGEKGPELSLEEMFFGNPLDTEQTMLAALVVLLADDTRILAEDALLDAESGFDIMDVLLKNEPFKSHEDALKSGNTNEVLTALSQTVTPLAAFAQQTQAGIESGAYAALATLFGEVTAANMAAMADRMGRDQTSENGWDDRPMSTDLAEGAKRPQSTKVTHMVFLDHNNLVQVDNYKECADAQPHEGEVFRNCMKPTYRFEINMSEFYERGLQSHTLQIQAVPPNFNVAAYSGQRTNRECSEAGARTGVVEVGAIQEHLRNNNLTGLVNIEGFRGGGGIPGHYGMIAVSPADKQVEEGVFALPVTIKALFPAYGTPDDDETLEPLPIPITGYLTINASLPPAP